MSLKLYLVLLFTMVILASLLIACSNNGSSVSDNKSEDRFPLSVGNEWTYGLYKLDMNHEYFGSPITTRSIKVVAKTNYKGKEAYEVERKGSLIYKYYSFEDNAIYGHIEYEKLSEDGKKYYPNDWMRIYDFDSEEWTIYSKELSINEDGYSAKADIIMTAEKTGKSNDTINGEFVSLTNYITVLSVEGTKTTNGLMSNISSKDTTYISFADGIGFYSTKIKKNEKDEEFINYGTDDRLLDYIIK